MAIDYSLTGPIANHLRPQATPAPGPLPPGSAPDGTRAPEGYRWDARFVDNPQLRGFVPETWDFNEIERQLSYERGRQQFEAEAPQRQAQLQREAEEAERDRPLTLEERVAALEAKVERLMAPTRMRPKSARSTRTTREGGDLPPAA